MAVLKTELQSRIRGTFGQDFLRRVKDCRREKRAGHYKPKKALNYANAEDVVLGEQFKRANAVMDTAVSRFDMDKTGEKLELRITMYDETERLQR